MTIIQTKDANVEFPKLKAGDLLIAEADGWQSSFIILDVCKDHKPPLYVENDPQEYEVFEIPEGECRRTSFGWGRMSRYEIIGEDNDD